MTRRAGVSAPIRHEWVAFLPLPPRVFNKSSNGWKAYHFPRKTWMLNASMTMMSQLPVLPKLQRIALGLTFYVTQEHDGDNLDGMRKHIYDLLKMGKGGLGIVPDDSPAHIVPDGFPQQVKVPNVRQRKTETIGAFTLRQRKAHQRLGVRLTITDISVSSPVATQTERAQ